MSFPVTVGLAMGDEKITYSSNQAGRVLGTRGVTPDGRVFRWALNAGTALEAGVLVQSAAEVGSSAHVSGLAVVNATATGVTTLTVTFATTPTTKDLYADGWLTIDTSPGQAMYRVKANAATDSGQNGLVTLYDDDEIKDPLTSGTTVVGLRRNLYSSVIVMPTTVTGMPIGITPISVAVNRYFWLQTWGEALVNVDVAPVAGERLIFDGTSAGHLDISDSGSLVGEVGDSSQQPTIGYAQTAGAGADKYHRIMLTLSP